MSKQAYAYGESSVTVHPSVNLYEVLSFLLLLPSMFISFVGFAFVAGNLVVAQELGRGQKILPAILIPFLNLAFVPSTAFVHYKWNAEWLPWISLPIPICLCISGYAALVLESRRRKRKSENGL